jgi:ATP-binding cassette subfamily F protein uup
VSLEGNGVVTEYVGGYDDWLRQRKAAPKPEPQKSPAKGVKAALPKEQVRKLTFKEKKELKELPALIEKLETEQKQLNEAMADPALYKKGLEVVAVTTRAGELKKQLDELYARWQQLEALK